MPYTNSSSKQHVLRQCLAKGSGRYWARVGELHLPINRTALRAQMAPVDLQDRTVHISVSNPKTRAVLVAAGNSGDEHSKTQTFTQFKDQRCLWTLPRPKKRLQMAPRIQLPKLPILLFSHTFAPGQTVAPDLDFAGNGLVTRQLFITSPIIGYAVSLNLGSN